MVAAGVDLSTVFCPDVSYQLNGVVIVHDPFEVGSSARRSTFLNSFRIFPGPMQKHAQLLVTDHIIEST